MHHRTNMCTSTCFSQPPNYKHCFKSAFILQNNLHRYCVNHFIMKIRIIYNTTQWIKKTQIYKVYKESSHDLMIKKATLKKIVKNVVKKKSTAHQFLFYKVYCIWIHTLQYRMHTCPFYVYHTFTNMENLTSIWFTNCY